MNTVERYVCPEAIEEGRICLAISNLTINDWEHSNNVAVNHKFGLFHFGCFASFSSLLNSPLMACELKLEPIYFPLV